MKTNESAENYLETILNEQNYISQASDIATKYGYVLAYDEENEIVSIQYSADFQQTDDFSYYSKIPYEYIPSPPYKWIGTSVLFKLSLINTLASGKDKGICLVSA